MVLRVWRGYTAPQDADTYEVMLGETILPGIHRVEGYRGAYLARRDGDHEVEFLTITLWESMDAVRAFSTDGGAVIHDAARPLLIRFDQFSAHYEASFVPLGGTHVDYHSEIFHQLSVSDAMHNRAGFWTCETGRHGSCTQECRQANVLRAICR